MKSKAGILLLLNWHNQTSYQSQFTRPNLLIQFCTLGTKPNLLNQTNSIILNLQSWINQAKSLKCKEQNITAQIFSIEPVKLNPPSQFLQTQSRETQSIENQSLVQSQLELNLAKLSPSLFCVITITQISWYDFVDLLENYQELRYDWQPWLFLCHKQGNMLSSMFIYDWEVWTFFFVNNSSYQNNMHFFDPA